MATLQPFDPEQSLKVLARLPAAHDHGNTPTLISPQAPSRPRLSRRMLGAAFRAGKKVARPFAWRLRAFNAKTLHSVIDPMSVNIEVLTCEVARLAEESAQLREVIRTLLFEQRQFREEASANREKA